MKPASPGVKLTYDDFLLFPDDGQRHELIDGEHYVTPSPIPRHQRIVGNLYWLIRSFLERHSIGEVFGAPVDIVLSHFDVVAHNVEHAAHLDAGRGAFVEEAHRDRHPDEGVLLDAAEVGKVISANKLRVLQHGEVVAEIPNQALTDDAPVYKRPLARWEQPVPREMPENIKLDGGDLTRSLKRLLASPNICGKRWVWHTPKERGQ